jgi:hypothetical protein
MTNSIRSLGAKCSINFIPFLFWKESVGLRWKVLLLNVLLFGT